MYLRCPPRPVSIPLNTARVLPARTQRPPAGTVSMPALPKDWVCCHTTGYWNDSTGAPSEEMMDIAEQWYEQGRTITSFDEAHIRQLPPDALVLEVGPGLGADLFVLTDLLPHGQIVAVEQCPLVLARLERWFIGHNNLRFVKASGLESLDLGPRRASYLRLLRVAPYFSDAELGRFLAKAEALLDEHGQLLLTAYHPCAMPDADPASGQGFGHHTVAALLQVARWHCGLRLARLQISVKELPGRKQRQLAEMDLNATPAESMDERIRALVLAPGAADLVAEVEMRLWFAKVPAPAAQPEV